jgi:hypothetical protein
LFNQLPTKKVVGVFVRFFIAPSAEMPLQQLLNQLQVLAA